MNLRALFLLLLLAPLLHAHDAGLSSSDLGLGAGQITLQCIFAPADLAALPTLPPEKVAQLSGTSGPLPPVKAVKWTDQIGDIQFLLVFNRTTDTELTLRLLSLSALPQGHCNVLTIRDAQGAMLSSEMLTPDAPETVISLAAVPRAEIPQPSLSKFLVLGIQHILTGYDHLLFLFGLLLVCPKIGDAVKIITCFTIAHSLTLALATFNLVTIPSRIVEPCIAASIVYVGLENIFAKNQMRWRWVLTFSFGLIHGLGFASVLRELGLGSNGHSVVGPLVCFNLGVEAGQLAVAALLLPFIFKFRAQPVFLHRVIPACSLLVALAGGYWLVERVWF